MIGKKIMIVEDDVTLGEMYKMKFEKEGFETKLCIDGFAAISKALEFKPNAILLDIMMPDMNGFETLEVIKKQTAMDTKIIMFSNLNSQSDIDKCMSMWADGYLVKAETTPAQAVNKITDLLMDGDVKSEEAGPSEIICPHCEKKIKLSVQ